jgi:hypothetical protein
MDDQFDDNLKKYISKAFENIELPTADEGWILLRKKFPEKEKDRPVVWLWRAAAAVAAVIILAFGIWINHQNKENNTIANKLPKAKREENKDLVAKKTIPDAAIDSAVYPKNVSPDKETIAKQPIIKSYLAPGVNRIYPADNMVQKSTIDNTIKPALDNYANTNLPASIPPDKTNTNSNTSTPINDSITNNKDQNIAKQLADPAVLPKTNAYTLKDNQPAPITNNEKKVKFGVYAATYFNYAKGSENQINMGLGFTSDIKISKKVKLSTGLAIAQNTLNYINQPSLSPSPNLLYNGVPANTTMLGTANAYSFTSAQSAPAIKDYNALLVGLDIPLNLKYEFNPQKSRNYIVVGLSSGTFINESYTYNFNPLNTRNYSNGIALNSIQQPQSQTTKNSFNDFYFARTLNVSFGIGYPLGKNHLIIEPFLKYPLAGLGAQQIHFGAGGVNLKFDFQSPSKNK